MLEALKWYLALQAIGLVGLPLTLRVLRSLPDRGWAFARPLGLFLVGYVLWLGSIFGLLQNLPVTTVVLVAILGVASWLAVKDSASAVSQVWREHRQAIVTTEALFMLAFAAWVAYRSFVPEIASTEKPMEFAFLNSILRSHSFPPSDPWMAGYSISYYYFGYLLTAVLTELSSVSSSVGFNLMIATLFALTATGAFSLGYNLVSGVRGRLGSSSLARRGPGATTFGMIAAIFTLLLANWEGLLEVLHAHGIGSAEFWAATGIHDLGQSFVSSTLGPTEALSPWWWFRASRVIATYTPDGKALDYTINEFPFFSFLLGDLHPHVLALPFATLALSFALAMLRETSAYWSWLERDIAPEWLLRTRLPRWVASYLYLYPREALRREPIWTLLIWVFFGGLSFLNAWDFPTYLFVLVGAFALRRYLARPSLDRALIRETLTFAWVSLIGGVLLYLPFYIGFRSQTSGIGLVPVRSGLLQFVIYWGPLLLIVGTFLVVQLARATLPERPDLAVRSHLGKSWKSVWLPVLGFSAILLLLQLPPIAARLPASVQAPALAIVVPMIAACAVLLGWYLGEVEVAEPAGPKSGERVGPRRHPARIAGGTVAASLAPEHVFVLFLAFTAALLLLGTELVFIRDLFGNRMNTVFKLYYQSWTLLAIVAAYGVYYLLGRVPESGTRRAAALAWVAIGGVAIAAALLYAPTSVASRASAGAVAPTLDGTAYLSLSNPADYAAIQWLRANVSGSPTIVEASGGSYSDAARISSNTGLPTLLGWDFHEQQWRGSTDEISRRQVAIDEIYQSLDRGAVASLLDQYGVEYVYVGPLETEKYGQGSPSSLTKFADFMDVVYNQDGVVIYRTRS